jgi:hypothetical protein
MRKPTWIEVIVRHSVENDVADPIGSTDFA